MDPKTLFVRAIDQASRCIQYVEPDHFANDTPCSEWDLKALLNHMVYEVLWVPDMLAGKTIAEVGDKYDGDVLGPNAKLAWAEASDKALAAVEHAGLDAVVHLSYADVPAKSYINELAADVLVHTWDLAAGLHCTLLLEKDVTQVVYDNTVPRATEYAQSGMFGTPVAVPDDADLQTRLLGLLGRKPFTA